MLYYSASVNVTYGYSQAVSVNFQSHTGPRIYIVGGKHCDDGTINNLDTVECFDIEKEDWIDGITPLPLPLLGPGVTYTT